MADSKVKLSFPSPTNDVAEDRTEPQAHPERDSADASAEQLLFVPIHLLERNPSQPRSTADEEKLEELISTILRDGLIQPIAVWPKADGTYQIVAGHRRVAAFQRLYERAQGIDEQRRYQAIPAIVRPALDDLKMATNAFIENDKREKLNLVDEASALTRIRDILSARLGHEASAKEVADAVGKRDEQRVGRLFRFHGAPDVVKEGVVGQRLVTKKNDGDLLPVVKTQTKGQKAIGLHAALEFSRVHEHFAVSTPSKADKKTKRIIERAREESWSFRRIQGYVKAIISGQTSRRFPSAAVSDEQGRLTVYLSRLPSAPADIRAQLRLRLKSILEELDRMAATSTAADAAGQSSTDDAVNADEPYMQSYHQPYQQVY